MNRIVDRLAAAREAVGPDAEIMIDGHMYYDVPDAIRLAHEIAPFKVTWLEDPVPISNPDALAQVRARSPVPICSSEMYTREQFHTYLDRGALDVVHPDVIFCGGLREARRIADYADAHYCPLALHGNGSSLAAVAAAHVGAASRNFLALEYHYVETDWIGRIVERGRPLFEDGAIHLTDAPGLGVELNDEVCRAHLADGESMF